MAILVSVNNVVKGDVIFHLRQAGKIKQFLGYSIANSDGYETRELPTPSAHPWSYSGAFYRADLTSFKRLNPIIELPDFFSTNEISLREYFKNRKQKHLFYAVQNSRLQCLYGAYFSEFNGILPNLLAKEYEELRDERVITESVDTGVGIKEVKQRIGHQAFAENVKDNFHRKCCYPNCKAEGSGYLVSGHIARWADNEALRGQTGNGLCLCLMHDKAFEQGLFTLDREYRVVINVDLKNKSWLSELLLHGKNLEIKPRKVNPFVDALEEHWKRIGIKT